MAKPRYDYLDGLRGVAALCVFTGHMIGGGPHELAFGQIHEGQRNYTIISAPLLRIFYSGGPAAVSIFFVLSGFVITQSFQRSAIIRRPIRLYLPCFAVTLLIALVFHLPYNAHPPWINPEASISAELLRLVKSWSFFWPWSTPVEAFYAYDIVIWTIPIELKGSYLCYALTALPYPKLHILATIGLLILGFWWQACFIAGYLLSLSSGRPSWIILIISILLLSVVQTSGHPEWAAEAPGYSYLNKLVPPSYESTQYYRFWTSIGAMGMVYSTLNMAWLQWVFNTAPLRYIGKVSFMLYLIHLPLAFAFSDRWIRIFGYTTPEPQWWDNLLWLPELGIAGFNIRWIVSWSTVLAVNLALSHILTDYIDQPTVKLSKWISKRLGLDPPLIELPK